MNKLLAHLVALCLLIFCIGCDIGNTRIHYNGEALASKIKNQLRTEGIPFNTVVEHDMEYIEFNSKYDADVDRISKKLHSLDKEGSSLITARRWLSDQNIWYQDLAVASKVKKQLKIEGIPFETVYENDREYIKWESKNDEDVNRVHRMFTPPGGRSAFHRTELVKMLKRAEIPFSLMQYSGSTYVTWSETDAEGVVKIIDRWYPDDKYGDARLLIDVGKIEKGIKLLQEASNTGDTKAQIGLGNVLTNGKYIEKNYEKALELYQLAAEKNDVVAYTRLGLAYYLGHGIEQNDISALNWFQKSAEAGEPLGMWMMGKFIKEGRGGIEKNIQKAQEWDAKAKAHGDFSAVENEFR